MTQSRKSEPRSVHMAIAVIRTMSVTALAIVLLGLLALGLYREGMIWSWW